MEGTTVIDAIGKDDDNGSSSRHRYRHRHRHYAPNPNHRLYSFPFPSFPRRQQQQQQQEVDRPQNNNPNPQKRLIWIVRIMVFVFLLTLAVRTRELTFRMKKLQSEEETFDELSLLIWGVVHNQTFNHSHYEADADRTGKNNLAADPSDQRTAPAATTLMTDNIDLRPLRQNNDKHSSRDRMGGRNNEPILAPNVTQQQIMMATVEKLDGMTESKRILLEAAFQNQQYPDYNHHHETTVEEDDDAHCKRYGFQFNITRRHHPRRIFWGSLIADDSWHVIAMASMEYYGLFHTISFVESNTTQILAPRTLRFFPQDGPRTQILTNPLLWGNTTQVYMDYYFDPKGTTSHKRKSLVRENMQRDLILQRWKQSGMTKDDIGFLSDIDEVGNRDYLLALQICDIPEFTPNRQSIDGEWYHDCIRPKLSASTLWYEATPKCVQIPRRYGRPDWILGECIQGIGNETLHPPLPRSSRMGANMRIDKWTKLVGNVPVDNHNNNRNNNNNNNNNSRTTTTSNKHTTIITTTTTNTTTTTETQWINGPLWDATDFRMIPGRSTPGTTSQGYPHFLPTAYHFHNFFDSLHVLRRKYKTYGHPKHGAMELPLSQIQPNDIGFMVDCLTGRKLSGSKWRLPGVSDWMLMDPIYGTPMALKRVPTYPTLRHEEYQRELEQDEQLHPSTTTIDNETKMTTTKTTPKMDQ